MRKTRSTSRILAVKPFGRRRERERERERKIQVTCMIGILSKLRSAWQ